MQPLTAPLEAGASVVIHSLGDATAAQGQGETTNPAAAYLKRHYVTLQSFTHTSEKTKLIAFKSHFCCCVS